jgi:hypothetical protein
MPGIFFIRIIIPGNRTGEKDRQKKQKEKFSHGFAGDIKRYFINQFFSENFIEAHSILVQ